ncbi:4-hydroxyphenylpyruvate dioxygenase-like [Silene latifolia]|uniref:4-hydroxyphenylpyruvate dioxygenase-like n=1 Tax=Silene latifolia TaxID=37657 RepID=UPI003D78A581
MGILSVPKNVQRSSNFVRYNPKSDRFKINGFHHIEFWCGDATNTSRCFSNGFGMPLVAKSDLSTGNLAHASYLLRGGNLSLLFTAAYPPNLSTTKGISSAVIPTFDYETHLSFTTAHGLAVRAVAVDVEDAGVAFYASVEAGANPVAEPVLLEGQVTISEVQLYGDVVLRYVSHANAYNGCLLPKFSPVNKDDNFNEFGIMGLDHVAACVPDLALTCDYIRAITGFHDFVEYDAEDMLGLTETAIKTVFMANNNESLVLNVSEPVKGTERNSYAQTFLNHNKGSGVQHLALLTNDIFKTVKEIKKRSGSGGFDFMPPPPSEYYKEMRKWAGDVLTEEQILECEKLSIKVDMDHEGVELQTFTIPIGDRPTLVLEIIQRIGCMVEGEDGKMYQKPACGGFGKGNVKRLVKSIEDYEKTLGLSDHDVLA